MSDKTEQPTDKRLRKAREQGDSPRSAALTQAVGFVVALTLAPSAIAALGFRGAELLRAAIEQPGRPLAPLDLALTVLGLSAPLLFAVALASAAASMVQTGGALSPNKLAPSLDRLNPWNGLKQLFSLERSLSVVRALAAAAFVAYFAWNTLHKYAADVVSSVGQGESAPLLSATMGKRVAWSAALLGLALGGIDFLVTQRAFLRRNRMTKHEVKREHLESEGNPEVKAARRRAHQEALAGSSLNAVKQATVLIVNPTHLATALRYDEEHDQAPLVIAQGTGELAQKMIDAARAYGVPVVRDVPVARALQEIEVGDEIPEALYETVAEILREAWETVGP
ncbi:MAG TPA: EscU/YscU/HrcU family type III secretion system export apparatus switch protein [Polyangiaceae bacterium]|nr:EscU/YscU/HrcU family type III secretion system export apparatus switch protein [Polyangiaceae bacterium]